MIWAMGIRINTHPYTHSHWLANHPLLFVKGWIPIHRVHGLHTIMNYNLKLKFDMHEVSALVLPIRFSFNYIKTTTLHELPIRCTKSVLPCSLLCQWYKLVLHRISSIAIHRMGWIEILTSFTDTVAHHQHHFSSINWCKIKAIMTFCFEQYANYYCTWTNWYETNKTWISMNINACSCIYHFRTWI